MSRQMEEDRHVEKMPSLSLSGRALLAPERLVFSTDVDVVVSSTLSLFTPLDLPIIIPNSASVCPREIASGLD